jgi:hypothetical protein
LGGAAGGASEAGLRLWIIGMSSSESDISAARPDKRVLRKGDVAAAATQDYKST